MIEIENIEQLQSILKYIEKAKRFNFDIDDIAVLLFDDDFVNDSYKSFYLDDEYEDQIAVIAEYLKDMFPYDKKVLIDVSW